MSNCALNFAFANEEECFVILETSCGSLKKPGVDDRMFTVGPIDFAQEQEFLDDEQIRAGASRLSPIKGRKTPGDLSFNTYVKPSGTVTTEPEADVLFECLMGAGAIDGSTYTYTLENQVDSYSLWVKKGHTVFAFRGATVQNAEFGISGDTIAGVSWSGNYMEQLWAGTGNADGGIDGTGPDVTAIPMKNGQAKRFCVGMYIEVGTNDNSAAGFLITAINYTTDVITIADGVDDDQGTDPEVKGWLPTASAEVGSPVHGKIGMVTINADPCIVLSAVVTISNNIKYYIDEKNNVFTAERFGRPKVREIEGNLNLYFLKEGPSYFYEAEYQQSGALIIPAGNVAGYIMELSIPYAEYRSPKISGDEEFIQDIPFIAVASSSLNDELSIIFK